MLFIKINRDVTCNVSTNVTSYQISLIKPQNLYPTESPNPKFFFEVLSLGRA
jgi:hypothetical protein